MTSSEAEGHQKQEIGWFWMWPLVVRFAIHQPERVCLCFKNPKGFQAIMFATLWYYMLERALTLAALLRELLALGFCYRVGSRSVRQFEA
ncbi:hypothetical protein MTR_4g056410 [Medicago truncatula]|uniref:Uncharacterized protein n=1 Tax=Medicago truncatula TaxID=3880 RepID=A0A072ULK0_MEDTR|nr:hypothetical protein MTR_4g056410 [Medicago truncatula]